jgi:CRP-like cAMP-binding protein
MIGDEAALVPHARGGRAAAAARALVDAALARGGRDNATVLVLDVAEPLTPRKTVRNAGADHATARASALLCDLPDAMVLRALAMAAEVEIAAGEEVPRIVTTDRVAYIVLDGEVEVPPGTILGASGLLYGESLVGVGRHGACRAVTGVRALRLRCDDFREICASDVHLAALLFERLARHLAERVR